jgi:hypothetical protein
MKIQLRQICLVAQELKPAIGDLTQILGINSCFVDPAVASFGLENTLMSVGHNFLEVVAPVEANTAAGRYLERRKGDGGYMVICQADSRESQQQVKARAAACGVRTAFESERENWGICQLHPADMKASFFEIDWDQHNDFDGNWHPAGGLGWRQSVNQAVTVDIVGVELQGPDPEELARRWSEVSGLPAVNADGELYIQLNNARLRFVEATDYRGPGLGGIMLAVADRTHILDAARAMDCFINEQRVDICGTRFYLEDAS